jgi:phosphate transport system substrate-binding protein
MPATDGRQGRRFRRALIKTISTAAAALSALALAACTSSAGTSSPPATASAAAATGGPAVQLTGSGSTYDAPFFNLAFPKYEQQNPAVTISYSSVGSSAGIAAITAKQVNFGASDVPMTATEQAAAQGGPVAQVPVDLGGEAVVYNLAGLPGVHLTGPVLAQIFLGQITNWDDPAIAALNPHLSFPNAPIFVVHRSDGSGTTYIFTNYLSSVDPTWAAKVGTGKTVNWPARDGEGTPGNPGVADAVSHTPFAIGYVESAYSHGPSLLDAAIRNQAGQYITPTPAAIAAAAAQKPDITSTDFSIVNQPGADSYPISGYSWALVYTHQASQATGQALVTMLNWLTHAGQASASAAGYVPLPSQIQQLALTTLQQVTGPGGTQLLGA